jgi:class 3 adenylate cyclase
MSTLPTGTITLLFTDIEGSTRLLQQLGESYATLLEEHRQLLRRVFHGHHGQEVDTQGDAFLVAFARATDAVEASVAAQHALASHAFPEGVAVRIRMGLQTGEPQRTAEGYVSLDVHRAARMMSAGHGGQVLLSQTTCSLVEQDLPVGVSLRDLGEHRLKDLASYRIAYLANLATHGGRCCRTSPLKRQPNGGNASAFIMTYELPCTRMTCVGAVLRRMSFTGAYSSD